MTFRTLMDIRSNLLSYAMILEDQLEELEEEKDKARALFNNGEIKESAYDTFYNRYRSKKNELFELDNLVKEIENAELK